MSIILRTEHLNKVIDGKIIVENVNINVEQGTIYGFVGPNGAGKTTVMKMMTNLWKPTAGKIELFGEELTVSSFDILKRMGSIIEFPYFYDHLSGKDNLKLHSEYMGVPGNVDEALDMLRLSDAGDKPVKNYSLGMKQRLGIARAILCKPELLILDEPTNGLDPIGIKQLRDLLKDLSRCQQMTIFISSHLLTEVESIVDKIGIMNGGRLITEKSISDLGENLETYFLKVTEESERSCLN